MPDQFNTMNKFNQYLLTRYPLIWNTKLVWVLIANCIIHLVFFALGFASLSLKTIRDFNSVWSVGGGTLFTFSILCSLLVIIVWLVYFLRNNAFKNFYRIDRWHLAKEFIIILLIIFSSINYFGSYNSGVRLKGRAITNRAALVKEINIVNKAIAFVPESKDAYFVLNNCEGRRRGNTLYPTEIDTSIIPSAMDTVTIKVTRALRRPDAFSYKHYCRRFFNDYYYRGVAQGEVLSEQRNQWIDARNPDSIRNAVNELIGICNRYGIELRLNSDAMARAVFAKPYNKIDTLIPGERYRRDASGNLLENNFYLYRYDLKNVFDFLDECHSSPSAASARRSALTVECYLALCASILLLTYRRFSRRVFLISIVGSIVWAIVIGLMVATAGERNAFPVICLTLCFFFLLIAWVMLRSRSSKTLAGVLLTWHSFLVPFVIIFIMMLISQYYSDQSNGLGYPLEDEMGPKLYPFSYWVTTHTYAISQFNLLLTIVYIAITFNSLAKNWHEQPQE